MSSDRQDIETNQTGTDGLLDVHASRRLMLRRSLGTVAPVVATLVSGRVSAQTCINASGFVSAATYASRHPNGTPPICQGVSPSNLAANGSSWGDVPKGTKFNTIFASGGNYKRTRDPKVMNELKGSNRLSMCVSAAYLNAKRGSAGYVVTADQAVAIWRGLCYGGTYTPPGLSRAWSKDETLAWLEMSWTS